jgi:hypothetical protein
MKLQQGHPVYSATDLSSFLACEHLKALDLFLSVTGSPQLPSRISAGFIFRLE